MMGPSLLRATGLNSAPISIPWALLASIPVRIFCLRSIVRSLRIPRRTHANGVRQLATRSWYPHFDLGAGLTRLRSNVYGVVVGCLRCCAESQKAQAKYSTCPERTTSQARGLAVHS